MLTSTGPRWLLDLSLVFILAEDSYLESQDLLVDTAPTENLEVQVKADVYIPKISTHQLNALR